MFKTTSQLTFLSECITNFRAHLIKAVAESVIPAEILPNHNKCIVHFLDLDVNVTVKYLKSAWTAGTIGQNHFYLAKFDDNIQLASLNFSEIFDFSRIFVIIFKVWFVSLSYFSIENYLSFQQNMKLIIQPNVYSVNDGFFNQVATWRPKIGYIIFFTEFRNLEPI